ncbi:endonuclease/exonuclease/phosphatase family protein [Dyadobacter sp. NIV53]|uniref:endonuclease/exonuclease/phosphatase family protein n=1 Tax=Dyadobacter sp. NIV53 TaxID=2861765 RepID=UPI0021036CE7|nr:endonuclease/exonuclease/phosphatase family protein [Dyadobacter sp. NIV53]
MDSIGFILPIDSAIKGETRTIAAITVEITKGRKVIFASTHLDLKEQNRLSQAALIVKHFQDSDLPVIIGGDFNALPDSEVIKYLDKSFTRSCLNCAFTIPVEVPDRTIDFVMYKTDGTFESVSTRVIDEKYASDHLPVVAVLRVK